MVLTKSLKRLTSVILCVALSISLTSATAVAAGNGLHNFKNVNTYRKGQFADVAVGAWYEANVEQAYNLGLMTGNSATTFNPTGNITQVETLTIAARIHKIYTTGNDDFSDIKQEMQDMRASILEWCHHDESSPAYQEFYNAWYAPYAYYLYSRVWPEGRAWYPQFPAIAFEPSDAPFIDATTPITREVFVSYLVGTLPESELQQINVVEDGAIPDISYSNNPDAYLLYRAGVLTGSDAKGTFAPTSYITRAEVAAIIARMVKPTLRKTVTLVAEDTNTDISSTTLINTCGNIGATIKEIKLGVRDTKTITITYYGSGSLTVNYNPDMVRTGWGEWDGDNITLTIKALQYGYSELEIFAENDMSSCIYVDVWASDNGTDSGNEDDNFTTSYNEDDYYKLAYDAFDYVKTTVIYPHTIRLGVAYAGFLSDGTPAVKFHFSYLNAFGGSEVEIAYFTYSKKTGKVLCYPFHNEFYDFIESYKLENDAIEH